MDLRASRAKGKQYLQQFTTTPPSVSSDERVLNQLLALIEFLDFSLQYASEPQHADQWNGLFRVNNVDEDDFQRWQNQTCRLSTSFEMKQFLHQQQQPASIEIAALMLKRLLTSLEFPLFPLKDAVHMLQSEEIQSTESNRALLGALFADMFLSSAVESIPDTVVSKYCIMGAQLFCFLRHVSLREDVTKMNAYNLCVVLLPAMTLSRGHHNNADAMEEMALLTTFAMEHSKRKLPCKMEMFITLGRRIWGVIYSMDQDGGLEAELSMMKKERNPLIRRQRRSVVERLFRRPSLTPSAVVVTPPLPPSNPNTTQQQQRLNIMLVRSKSTTLTTTQELGGLERSPSVSRAMESSRRRRLNETSREGSSRGGELMDPGMTTRLDSPTSPAPLPPQFSRPTSGRKLLLHASSGRSEVMFSANV